MHFALPNSKQLTLKGNESITKVVHKPCGYELLMAGKGLKVTEEQCTTFFKESTLGNVLNYMYTILSYAHNTQICSLKFVFM